MHGVAILGIALAATGCSQIFGLEAPAHGGDATEGCGWHSLAAGTGHTCVIGPDQAVYCWGGNWLGQVEGGAANRGLTATRVVLPGAAVQVATGRETTCARLADGSAWCWGGNSTGQLGNGTVDYTESIVRVMLDDRIDDISAGGGHVCARRESDHALVCWGDNRFNQLAMTGAATSPVPVVVAGTTGTEAFAAGHRHTCAVLSGTLTCWGRNQRSQAGGPAGNPVSSPQIVAAPGPVTAIASAGGHNCVLDETRGVSCWGEGNNGQLGYATDDMIEAPATIALTEVAEVGTSNFGACARKTDGTLWCWGATSYGDGRTGMIPVPQQIPVAPVTELAVGSYHTCVVAAGEVQCWGSDASGQLGRGVVTQYPVLRPTSVPAGADRVAAGSYYACARVGNQLHCWGANGFGQLGDRMTLDRATPVMADHGLAALDGFTTGHLHTCAWGGGVARCWGANYFGQLGNGSVQERTVDPVTVSLTGVAVVAAGQDHTCALSTAGAVRCWGANYFHQLGNGSTTSSSTPVAPMLGGGSGSGLTGLTVGWRHTCVISGTSARCWGENTKGQLGDGTAAVRTGPVLVTGISSVIKIAAGRTHTCALDSNGDVFCWGSNSAGELGQNDTTDRLIPTKVNLPLDAIEIIASDRSSCARLINDAVYCWGWGWGGEIPLGEFTEYLTPVEVPALAGSASLTRGPGGGCAITNNAVHCWGDHTFMGAGDSSPYTAAPPILDCPR